MTIKALSGKVFLVITGASRGIGRHIAILFGSVLEKDSHVLLLATNLTALKDTAKNIPSHVSVDTVSVDLSKATKDELHGIIMQSMKDKTPEQFDKMVVVHNVGTMGDLTKVTNDMTDITMWRNYYDLNVFVPAILNAVIMKIFNEVPDDNKTVINITSLLATQPYKSTAYYCSGKAAREMFFKVFAVENPEVNVLNYSPGPVETDMLYEVCRTHGDQDIKASFNDMLTKKTVLTCEQTVNRLLNVLKNQKYTSGDHVDYYDEL
ncbi:sepiapterin reductase [Megalopta genalis]|uniref:sepiapterin reductase n=1 Tax=Megalopta genalis TaxID=115081 RepID=UPI0014435B97|nr:sepiapterin reductase-like [Megalopta genalis]